MAITAVSFPVKDGLVKALSGTVTGLEAASIYFFVQGSVALTWALWIDRKVQFASLVKSIKLLFFARTFFQVSALVLFFVAVNRDLPQW